MEALIQSTVTWLTSHGVRIVLIVVIAIAARAAGRALVNRLFKSWLSASDTETQKRVQTLSGLATSVVGVVIFAVAFIMALSEFGVDVGPIIAAAGIVGVAIGFGSQQLVQDVLSGFFMLLEDQVRVGDVIMTGGRAGVVEHISLRTIKLRELNGNVHYVRNGQVDVITNMTKEYAFAVFDVGVGYRENVDEVMEVIKKVADDVQADDDFAPDILEPVEVLGLDSFGDSAVVVKARIKTKPIKQWRIAREFNRRLKIAFDEADIEIPFPHLTVYAGVDKHGKAPALPVRNEPSAQRPLNLTSPQT